MLLIIRQRKMKKIKFCYLLILAMLLPQVNLRVFAEVGTFTQKTKSSEIISLHSGKSKNPSPINIGLFKSSLSSAPTEELVKSEYANDGHQRQVVSSTTEANINISPTAVVTSTWGTSPWSFNSSTGELTIDTGTLSEGTANKNLDSPWNRTDEYKIDPKEIKTITFTGKVVAPKISNYLFSVDGYSGLNNLDHFDGLSNLDTTQVTSMQGMFIKASSLKSLDLDTFNTNNVTNLRSTFEGLTALTYLDLSKFDTSKVTSMWAMFKNNSNLTSLNLTNFNTNQVTDMHVMFSGLSAITNLDLSKFDTTNVRNMSNMFSDSGNLKILDLTNFNTNGVTNMTDMFKGVPLSNITLGNDFKFKGTEALSSPTYSGLKGSATGNWMRIDGNSKGYSPNDFMTNFGAGDLSAGTYGAERLLWGTSPWSFDSAQGELIIDSGILSESLESPWNRKDTYRIEPQSIKKITINDKISLPVNSSYLFSKDSSIGLSQLSEISGLANLDSSQVTNMTGMFFLDDKLSSLDLSSFDTKKVLTMQDMFNGASGLMELIVSSFDTRSVTSMKGMFSNLSQLTTTDLSHFNTQNVTNMQEMFSKSKFINLDLSSFYTTQVTQSSNMFDQTSLVTFALGTGFKFNGSEALSAPNYIDSKGIATGRWTREDGRSKGYLPKDFMLNYGLNDLSPGTYLAELENAKLSLSINFDQPSGSVSIGDAINSTIIVKNENLSNVPAESIQLDLKTLYSEKLEEAITLPSTANMVEIDETGTEISSSIISFKQILLLPDLAPGHSYKIQLDIKAINNTSVDSSSNYLLSLSYLSGKDTQIEYSSGVYHIGNGKLSFYQVPDTLEFPATTLSGNKLVQRSNADWSYSVTDLRGTNPKITGDLTSIARTNWDVVATSSGFEDAFGNIIPSSTLALTYTDSNQNIQELSANSELLINHHDTVGEMPIQNRLTTLSWNSNQGIQVKINNYQLLKKNINYQAQLNLDLRQAP